MNLRFFCLEWRHTNKLTISTILLFLCITNGRCGADISPSNSTNSTSVQLTHVQMFIGGHLVLTCWARATEGPPGSRAQTATPESSETPLPSAMTVPSVTTADSDFTSNVWWTHDEVPLHDSNDSNGDSPSTLVFKNGSLLLETITLDKAGIYTCFDRSAATDELESGQMVSRTNVTVVVPGSEFLENPVSQTVHEGESVMLACSPPQGYSPSNVIWYFNNRRLTLGDGVSILSSGFLHVASVDREYDGVFLCISSAPLLPSVTSTPANLTVLYGPEVTQSPSDVSVLLDRSAVLSCLIQGRPRPVISWFRRMFRSPLNSGGNHVISNHGSVLTILRATHADSGSYGCVGKSSLGEVASPQARLTVLTPPYFDGGTNFSTKSRTGSTVVLPCQYSSNSPANVTWTKDGADVSFTGRVSVSGGDLHLRNIQPSDSGFYTCSVTNAAGRASRSGVLSVEYSPHMVNLTLPQYVLTTQPYMMVSCNAAAVPPANISIYIEGQLVATGLGFAVCNYTDLEGLTGDPISCSAQNQWGTAAAEANVIVYTHISIAVSGENVTVGYTLSLRCSVEGRPAPSISWTKQGSSTVISNGKVLEIVRAQVNDTGIYTCSAETLKFLKNDSIFVNIEGVPIPPHLTAAQTLSQSTIALHFDRSLSENALRYAVFYKQSEASDFSEYAHRFEVSDEYEVSTIVVANLQSDTLYTFALAAEGEAGLSGYSNSINARTFKSKVPTVVPLDISLALSFINSSSCVVLVRCSEEVDEELWIFEAQIRETADASSSSWSPIATKALMSDGLPSSSSRHPCSSAMFGNLTPYTQYEVRVRPVRVNMLDGENPVKANFTLIVVTTLAAAPTGSVEGLSVSPNAREATIMWTPPTYCAAPISSCLVNFLVTSVTPILKLSSTPLSSPTVRTLTEQITIGGADTPEDIVDETVKSLDSEISTTEYASKGSTQIIGLVPWGDYSVAARLVNPEGNGQWMDDPLVFQTDPAAPMAFPEAVSVSEHWSEKDVFTWDPIATSNWTSDISEAGYFVEICCLEADPTKSCVETWVAGPSAYNVTVDLGNMSCSSNLTVKVAAQTQRAGGLRGPFSSATVFLPNRPGTEVPVPSPPVPSTDGKLDEEGTVAPSTSGDSLAAEEWVAIAVGCACAVLLVLVSTTLGIWCHRHHKATPLGRLPDSVGFGRLGRGGREGSMGNVLLGESFEFDPATRDGGSNQQRPWSNYSESDAERSVINEREVVGYSKMAVPTVAGDISDQQTMRARSNSHPKLDISKIISPRRIMIGRDLQYDFNYASETEAERAQIPENRLHGCRAPPQGSITTDSATGTDPFTPFDETSSINTDAGGSILPAPIATSSPMHVPMSHRSRAQLRASKVIALQKAFEHSVFVEESLPPSMSEEEEEGRVVYRKRTAL